MIATSNRWFTQATGSRATERYGTVCRDAAGQWRIVN